MSYHQHTSRIAFSLLEVMIALVILGLGMVMAGTIFPVAWQRARTISEFTIQQTVISAAQTSVASLVSVSGPGLNAAGFAGDLVYDADYSLNSGLIVSPSDTRVHALHLENIQIVQQQFVPEDPWAVERIENLVTKLDKNPNLSPGPELIERSYDTPQIMFHQRIHPPIRKRTVLNPSGLFGNDDPQWDDTLASRRFCWGVLHRLRSLVGPDPNMGLTVQQANDQAAAEIGSSRSFDMYYVLLRRSQPTNRYARQDPTTAPNTDTFITVPQFAPAARPGAEDVMFPVPWRVEIQFPPLINAENFTGIPTEIQVPPDGFRGNTEARLSLVQMFPKGAQFVDEISGAVYRVTKRRLVGSEDTPEFHAVLTLDREVFVEDVDLERTPACDLCGLDGDANLVERLRTIWIYPPPAEPRIADRDYPIFRGTQPVVSIDVRTMSIPASE